MRTESAWIARCVSCESFGESLMKQRMSLGDRAESRSQDCFCGPLLDAAISWGVGINVARGHLTKKVSDGSQPPMTFDLSLSESPASGSLDQVVRYLSHSMPIYPIRSQP